MENNEKEIHEFKKEYLNNMRQDRISNNLACMLSAIDWSQRSKDPSSQVGACYVTPSGREISMGYNGAPNNWPDEEFPWGRDVEKDGMNNTKYPYVIHAEMNGILNYRGLGSDFEGSTLFVTLFPCSNCAKFLAQRGISKVVYLSDKYNGTEDNIAAKTLLSKCKVEYVKFNDLSEEEVKSFIDLINSFNKGKARTRDKNEH